MIEMFGTKKQTGRYFKNPSHFEESHSTTERSHYKDRSIYKLTSCYPYKKDKFEPKRQQPRIPIHDLDPESHSDPEPPLNIPNIPDQNE